MHRPCKCTRSESYRYGAPREPRACSSPALEFPTPKGLIANRVHCPATLLNGERRYSSGVVGCRAGTMRGLNYERRVVGAFVFAVEDPRVRRSDTVLEGLNLLFVRLIITSVTITTRLESNCDAHATCIILRERETVGRPGLSQPLPCLKNSLVDLRDLSCLYTL